MDEVKIICVCCEDEATVFLDLKNMLYKEFAFCQKHSNLIVKIYEHGESQDSLDLGT